MVHDLEQIEYRLGMFEKGMKQEDLPVKVWRGQDSCRYARSDKRGGPA